MLDFSGVSTGACIGHVGPEALAGGPIGKLRNDDVIELMIDRESGEASVDLIGPDGSVDPAGLAAREIHPELAVHADLPDDTRLWAALVEASGGTWGGCVYDVDRIIDTLHAGTEALAAKQRSSSGVVRAARAQKAGSNAHS